MNIATTPRNNFLYLIPVMQSSASRVTPGEGRDLSSRQTQYVVRDRGLGNLSTPLSVQKLQMALHAKAKAEAGYRFYALYEKISREDILAHAYAQCRSNRGAIYQRIAHRFDIGTTALV